MARCSGMGGNQTGDQLEDQDYNCRIADTPSECETTALTNSLLD